MKTYRHAVAAQCAETREQTGEDCCRDPRCVRCFGDLATFCTDAACTILPEKWPKRAVHGYGPEEM